MATFDSTKPNKPSQLINVMTSKTSAKSPMGTVGEQRSLRAAVEEKTEVVIRSGKRSAELICAQSSAKMSVELA